MRDFENPTCDSTKRIQISDRANGLLKGSRFHAKVSFEVLAYSREGFPAVNLPQGYDPNTTTPTQWETILKIIRALKGVLGNSAATRCCTKLYVG